MAKQDELSRLTKTPRKISIIFFLRNFFVRPSTLGGVLILLIFFSIVDLSQDKLELTFIAIICLLSFALNIWGLLSGFKENRLLVFGRLTLAKIVSVNQSVFESTGDQGQRVFENTYRYEVGQTNYSIKERIELSVDEENKQKEDSVKVLYQTRNPRNAILLERLPGNGVWNEQVSKFTLRKPAKALLGLFVYFFVLAYDAWLIYQSKLMQFFL